MRLQKNLPESRQVIISSNQTDEINNVYMNLKIFSSIDPDHPNAQGVAIALNGQITNTQNIKTTVISRGELSY
jgi:hypothetical protein